jgi:hypothetical protein
VISLRPNSASERSATLNGSSSVGMSTPVVRAVGLVLGLLVLVGLDGLMRFVRCHAFGC